MENTTTKYGTVERKVHEVARQFENCDYYFANFAQANVQFDKIEKPTIFFVLPVSGRMTIKNDVARDQPETQIWFLCPSNFDFEGDENDCRVEAMKRIGLAFIKALNDSGYFEYIDDFNYQVAYDAMDMNLTGVCFMPRLNELQGVLMCTDDYIRPGWDETEETEETDETEEE